MNKWRGNPWAILAVLSLGFFMTLLDLTIVNIAIPDMVERLNASLDQILWVVNAYALALAVLLITAGRLGDLRGKKTLYLSGVALFTLASLACGLAQGPGQLIAFRAIQGVGAAMLIPQTLSVIVEVFPAERRGAALGIWGATAGLSGAAGPSLGGLLVSRLDWRWIFFVNVPIGVLVVAAGLVVMPAAKRTVRHRFDIPGVVLASVSLFCLAFGLIEGEKYDWNGWIWAMIAAAVITMATFVVYERGQQDNDPLVPFELFRERGVVRHRRAVPAADDLPAVGTRVQRGQGRAPDASPRGGVGRQRRAGRCAVRAARRQVHPDGRPRGVRWRAGLDHGGGRRRQ
jgi:EmrB/QacA subfamily drug resistance transporter